MSADAPDKSGHGTTGRDSGTGNGGAKQSGNVTTAYCTSRQGSVVIRATVEHIGVVGETEMTVHVRWPASSFCEPCCDEAPTGAGLGPVKNAVPKTGPGAYIAKATAPDLPAATPVSTAISPIIPAAAETGKAPVSPGSGGPRYAEAPPQGVAADAATAKHTIVSQEGSQPT